MVGVTHLHRKGYFRQKLDEWGGQSEEPVDWRPEDVLQARDQLIMVLVEGREVRVRGGDLLPKTCSGGNVRFEPKGREQNARHETQRRTDHQDLERSGKRAGNGGVVPTAWH
jgi:hypothetical protein